MSYYVEEFIPERIELGDTVEFDHPDGGKEIGEIVRIYFGGGYHVLYEGKRIFVDDWEVRRI